VRGTVGHISRGVVCSLVHFSQEILQVLAALSSTSTTAWSIVCGKDQTLVVTF